MDRWVVKYYIRHVCGWPYVQSDVSNKHTHTQAVAHRLMGLNNGNASVSKRAPISAGALICTVHVRMPINGAIKGMGVRHWMSHVSQIAIYFTLRFAQRRAHEYTMPFVHEHPVALHFRLSISIFGRRQFTRAERFLSTQQHGSLVQRNAPVSSHMCGDAVATEWHNVSSLLCSIAIKHSIQIKWYAFV